MGGKNEGKWDGDLEALSLDTRKGIMGKKSFCFPGSLDLKEPIIALEKNRGKKYIDGSSRISLLCHDLSQ